MGGRPGEHAPPWLAAQVVDAGPLAGQPPRIAGRQVPQAGQRARDRVARGFVEGDDLRRKGGEVGGRRGGEADGEDGGDVGKQPLQGGGPAVREAGVDSLVRHREARIAPQAVLAQQSPKGGLVGEAA